MKYVDTKVVFREVPEELTLAVNISNCPVGCAGCHSPYLHNDIGDVLDIGSVEKLILSNPGITCFSFMGGDAEPMKVREYALWIRKNHPEIKTCWYSGRNLEQAAPVLDALDFIKVGPFIEAAGPLDSPTTNQRFYKIEQSDNGPVLTDWTSRFWPSPSH